MPDKIADRRKIPYTIIDIPVLEDERLSGHAKLAYVMLCRYANNQTNQCFPGQSRLAKLMGVSKPTVIKSLRQLEETGYISIQRRTQDKSKLTNLYTLLPVVKEVDQGSKGDLLGVVKEVDQGSKGDLHELVSTNQSKENQSNIPYREIIEFLNQAANTNYRHQSKNTRSMIRARWEEGFRLEDFKTVIRKKAKEWRGGEYAKYLRPETLFRPSKFKSYLNEPEVKKKGEFNPEEV